MVTSIVPVGVGFCLLKACQAAGAIAVELRPGLMPPVLDEAKVRHLADLASRLDGANCGQWEGDLAEFNQEAGTGDSIEVFQGIYGAENHEAWVRRVLDQQSLTPNSNLLRAEMAEIVLRVRACGADHDFDLELFLANCKHPSGSDFISWPDLVSDLPQNRQPTDEEIADLAMRGRA